MTNSQRQRAIKKDLGLWLWHWREVEGITQGELAQRLGVKHESIVGRMENGTNWTLNNTIAVSKLLDVKLSELIAMMEE